MFKVITKTRVEQHDGNIKPQTVVATIELPTVPVIKDEKIVRNSALSFREVCDGVQAGKFVVESAAKPSIVREGLPKAPVAPGAAKFTSAVSSLKDE